MSGEPGRGRGRGRGRGDRGRGRGRGRARLVSNGMKSYEDIIVEAQVSIYIQPTTCPVQCVLSWVTDALYNVHWENLTLILQISYL